MPPFALEKDRRAEHEMIGARPSRVAGLVEVEEVHALPLGKKENDWALFRATNGPMTALPAAIAGYQPREQTATTGSVGAIGPTV